MTGLHILGKRYLLQHQLGVGGMGVVYQAVDQLTQEVVALKRILVSRDGDLPSSAVEHLDFRLALAQEFQLLASLRHPHVINVLDFGFDQEKMPFFTMEYLENARTIRQADEQQSQETKLNLLLQVLQALAYLHRRRIIHRDLKPSNLLVARQRVKVLDFGLSTMLEEVSADMGPTVGTLAYMAPEMMLNPGAATERSDLYAVGLLLYEMLAGRHPFHVESVTQLFDDIMYSIPDVNTLDIDPRLGLVIQRLTAKNPADRYGSADETIQALCDAADLPYPTETIAIRESFLQAAQFVGRENELRQLDTALKAATKGVGSAWLIGGESGVGKSRLMDELRVRALIQNCLVLHGQGVSGGGLPYQLWREPLRRLIVNIEVLPEEALYLKPLVPDINDLVGYTVPDAPEEGHVNEQQRYIDLILSLLKRQPDPVMILMEDLQWTVESLEILKGIIPAIRDLPVLIIGNYRDDEHPTLPEEMPAANVIKLSRLPQTEIVALSASMLGEAGRQAHVVDWLQRETEGNVFFLVEVIRALAEEAGQLSNIGLMTLPARVVAGGIQRIVERRLSLVPETHRSLLQLAAIFGRQINLEVLRVLLPEATALDTWLIDCANAAILEIHNTQWRFAHDKLREGLLDNLSQAVRPGLHRQIARAIEQAYPNTHDWVAILAQHWRQGGDTDKERDYSELAGRQAYRISSYTEAQRFWERTLELLPDTPENQKRRTELSYWLAECAGMMDSYEAIEKRYLTNLAAAQYRGDQLGIANAKRGLGWVANRQGYAEKALPLLQESIAMFRVLGDIRGEGEAVSNLGSAYRKLGNLDKTIECYEVALQIAHQINDPEGIMAVSSNLGDFYRTKLNLAKALACYHTSASVAQETGDRYFQGGAAGDIGDVYLETGQAARAFVYHQKAIALAREANILNSEADALLGLGNNYREQGQITLALECYAKGLALCQEIQYLDGEGEMWIEAAYAHLYTGDLPKAAAAADSATALAAQIKTPALALRVAILNAYLHLLAGEFTAALAALQAVKPYSVLRYSHQAALIEGITHLKLGQPAQAAFQQAVQISADILAVSPTFYDAAYTLALAHTGLHEAPDFATAHRLCHAPYVIQKIGQLLALLNPPDQATLRAILDQPFALRVMGEADLPEVVGLLHSASTADGDDRRVTLEELHHQLTAPGVDRVQEFWLALNATSEIVGYLMLQIETETCTGIAQGVVAPQARGQGLGTHFITFSEERFSQHFQAGQAVTIYRKVIDSNTSAAALFAAHGYQAVRTWNSMRIDLDQRLEPPALPAGFVLRPFEPERDAYNVYLVDQEAFQSHYNFTPMAYEYWSHHLLHSELADPALWKIIVVDDGEYNQIAGVAINAPWDHTQTTGFVYVLAVAPRWRKHGLGQALLLHTFAEFQQQGYTRVDLNVDADNTTNAVALYERVGMRVRKRYLTYAREIVIDQGKPH